MGFSLQNQPGFTLKFAMIAMYTNREVLLHRIHFCSNLGVKRIRGTPGCREKVALVTGGSRGIGRACSLALARQGYRVGINFTVSQAAASGVKAEIEALGGKAFLAQGDVSSEEDVIAIFDAAEQTGDDLCVLVNNAGIVAESAGIESFDCKRIERILAVNVLGAFLCCREAARRFTKGGSIINISSIASRLGAPFNYVDYAASKGAVDTMTRGLAIELAGKGIRVNAVRPGWVDTEIHASGGKPDLAFVGGRDTPLGRCGTPEEVAEMVAFLADGRSSYMTGSLVDISGGL